MGTKYVPGFKNLATCYTPKTVDFGWGLTCDTPPTESQRQIEGFRKSLCIDDLQCVNKKKNLQPPPCTHNLHPGDAALVTNDMICCTLRWSNDENYIEVTNLPSELFSIAFTTSDLFIASKCVISSLTLIFGK